jgi:hypothetical protein
MREPPRPPDPSCFLCSKPVRSGTLVMYEHGELFHVWCRSQRSQLAAIEHVERATAAHKRAVELLEEARRERGSQPTPAASRRRNCPICGQAATITDWRPSVDWLAVEGCACGDCFIWTPLLDARLPGLTAADRDPLRRRIREIRSAQNEAWVTTGDGTVTGPLVVQAQRPDRTP